MVRDCAFDDKSMQFVMMLRHTLGNSFGFKGIVDFSCGSHVEKQLTSPIHFSHISYTQNTCGVMNLIYEQYVLIFDLAFH